MTNAVVRKALCAGATLALLVAVSTPCAAGWTPPNTACNQTPPGTGTITMTGSAGGVANCACTVLLSPNQTLRMNNHTITCTGAGPTTGVCMNGPSEALVGVGAISGCTVAGVSLSAAAFPSAVKKVQIFSSTTGIIDAAVTSGTAPSKLVNNFVVNNSTAGIQLTGTGALVHGNIVTGNGTGILDTSATIGVFTGIYNNSVSGNIGDGISVTSTDRVKITTNKVASNGAIGIDLASGTAGCVVEGNFAFLNPGDDLFDGNTTSPCGTNTWLNDIFGVSNQVCAH